MDESRAGTRESGDTTPGTKARDLLERGWRLQLEGCDARAAALYRESIALAPTPLAHTLMGWALAQGGDIDAAIEQCELAIRLDPGLGNPWSDIGAYLMEKGDDERAVPYLTHALGKKRFERHHYAHLNLGRVHRKQGLLMKALDEFRIAARLEPRDSHAKRAIREVLRNFN